MKKIHLCVVVSVFACVPQLQSQGTIDTGTQRNQMHSCPVGQFIIGVQENKNRLLCLAGKGDFAHEVVDGTTQEQNMHACPPGMAMTGLQASKNLLACTPLTDAPASRLVDSTTQAMNMHACPGPSPVAGIDVKNNVLLCAYPQTGQEIEDAGTQRNSMHSCPLGRYITGAEVARNLLLCTLGSLDASSEIVDGGTQSHGMHACPEGFVMTGFHQSTNEIACTHFNAALIPRIVDSSTQRQGMHACRPGLPVSGIQVTQNLLLCGDQYVVNVNSFMAKPSQILIGGTTTISWNVTCTEPGCVVTIFGGNVGGYKGLPLDKSQYVGSETDTPTTSISYKITAVGGLGTSKGVANVQVGANSYLIQEQSGDSCSIVIVTAGSPEAAQTAAKNQCACTATVVPAGTECPPQQ